MCVFITAVPIIKLFSSLSLSLSLSPCDGVCVDGCGICGGFSGGE